jgi:diguanylate cyclase (GGDEF)-like protein
MVRQFSLISLLLLCLGGHASAAVVLDSPVVNLTDFPMATFIDETETMAFEAVRSQAFTPSSNRVSLGAEARTTWSRIGLVNHSGQDLELFLHHPYAYHNRQVAFFLEDGDTLVDRKVLDLDQASDSPLMYRGSAVYPFRLEAGQSRTLYVRSVSYSHQWFTLLLLDEDRSRRALIGSHIDIALLIGILLALIVYNFLLYLVSGMKENILYAFYLISGAVWIALSYGLLAQVFNVYGAGVFRLHLSLITMPIFLILFMMAIFETRRDYPTEHRCLQLMLLPLLADLVYGLFDIYGALKPASSLAALMMVVTVSVSISLYRKGNPLAKYFLIGHSCFLLFNGMAVLFYKGMIDFTYLASHGVGIGITLEALMLAFIIAYRIRILEDIKASQADLRLQALTDPLTRLYNRRHFFTEAGNLADIARQKKMPLSALIMDIDHFKAVNDSHGHAVGDRVLVELAQVLRSGSRSSDLIARFGGEEFVILLPNCGQEQAATVAENIRQAVADKAMDLDGGRQLHFTISLGVAELDLGAEESVNVMLNRADQALYQAKRAGRNQVRVYTGNGDVESYTGQQV